MMFDDGKEPHAGFKGFLSIFSESMYPNALRDMDELRLVANTSHPSGMAD